ncbi:MAG TPA: putative baseplate assembly protein [Thermoanaerobaculia bacterium]
MTEPCSCGCSCACGCCEGVEPLTPQTIANRPGLDALAYRVGTHSSFLETMQARLSSSDHPELSGLTTRDAGDPSPALLDAWAVVGDVLTFYQERIANEGYLRTATERRSVLELARLVGYAPRPGVAASTYLAYTLDAGPEAFIPAGAAARSVPGPGEMPQVFETMEDLVARYEWNNLQVRLTRPQSDTTWNRRDIWLQGISTQLKVNDPLLIGSKALPALYRVTKVEPDAKKDRTRIQVEPWVKPPTPTTETPPTMQDFLASFAELADLEKRKLPANTAPAVVNGLKQFQAEGADEPSLRAVLKEAQSRLAKGASPKVEAWLENVVDELQEALQSDVFKALPTSSTLPAIPSNALLGQLAKPPKAQPRSGAQLNRSVAGLFQPESDVNAKLLAASQPALRGTLYTAWANAPATAEPDFEVHALRARAAVFGHNAIRPLISSQPDDDDVIVFTRADEWTVDETGNILFLDAPYPQILPQSWIVLAKPDGVSPQARRIAQVSERSREAYGIAGKTTRIELGDDWILDGDDFSIVRGTAVFAQSELLPLAEEPLDPVLEDVGGGEIEMAWFYDGLKTGRWVIVSGERTDVTEIDFDGNEKVVPGIQGSELAMLAELKHGVHVIDLGGPSTGGSTTIGTGHTQRSKPLPGDRTHTFLTLAKDLQYRYKRDTVVIYGNVAKATHGETRPEVLGSGDAAKSLQSFTLKQPPLTYVSAPTPSGIESTLKVRVNDVLWHAADSLAGLGPADRAYIVRIDDGGQTTVVFGNGERGARLPTGPENVRAVYRNGIGKGGNLKAGQISQLATRPLGVKDVINPLPSTGGADRESRDQARRNAPLAVMALDRLVSVQDYADFARTFAGVGKAGAALLSDGAVELVYVTIAGEDDIPIATDSELFQNLEAALRRFGDPRQPLLVEVRERSFLVVEAEVKVLPDYLWEKVEAKIRAAMLETFGFDRRDLAQSARRSEAFRVMQGVPGVDYVDINVFARRDPDDLSGQLEKPVARPARMDPDGTLRPAQLLYLSPEVADTLILKERKS